MGRRKKEATIEPATTSIVISTPPPQEEQKKKLGRPIGAGTFQNGVIPEKKIFLFVPRDSIAERDIQRFLQLCDAWIKDLGPETLKDTDLEEIALYCRDRLYMDGLYKTFAEAETIDPNLVNQIEKMNKSMEARKTNLGSRFIDRGSKRDKGSAMSFIDLFENFSDNSDEFVRESELKKASIQKNRESFTNPIKYMEGHILNKQEKEDKDF